MATSFIAIAVGIVVLAGAMWAARTDRAAVPIPVQARHPRRPGRWA